MKRNHPIGIFDSGYGGLTILKEIRKLLPQYDYIYLGDNARTPYGTRSFDVVFEYTLEAVKKLFELNCELTILACNTASAKALRNIQQNILPEIAPEKRVLGVIRPSVEEVLNITRNKHIGVLGTNGTVSSGSYLIELEKISNGELVVTQEACPMWVPIVENNEIGTMGANYFVEKNITQLLSSDPEIDTIILGCTHYPLLSETIRKYLPDGITLVEQGPIVAKKMLDYLNRHPEMEEKCSAEGSIQYFTTEQASNFEGKASIFMDEKIEASTIRL
ncbi:MAG TPA: glutamate racemase [Prolixibacteraceae bacterium]|nr:glutamate racemase [Bacteroidales bacterium]HNZ71871.1 glutamate racemase [Prolixibacteraceae bacterium]HQN92796.1 glutamate racemase [Prolixibacteraceae bacterium]